MRNILPILIAAIALVGCHTPSTIHTQTAAPAVATPPPFPMLITTLGTYSSPDGSWQIEVSEDSINLRGLGFTPDSHGWRAQAGWFIFSESESRVWAYDGGSRLYLAAFYPSSCALYPASIRATNFAAHFPCAVPLEVISHLPEQKQKQTQTHG